MKTNSLNSMRPVVRDLLRSTVLATAMIVALPAAAQTAAPTATPAAPATASETEMDAHQGDIIVTARQRNETLMSVPVAVTAVSGAALSRFGVTDVKELTKLSPTLVLDHTGSGAGGTVALRGVSTSPGQAGFDQAVAIVVDGVQTGRPRILSQGLLDVGQVEVLEGPQALFFGKNSPAGVISIKSAGSTRELEGYVRGGYEFVANEAIIEGAISGPINDDFGFRIAARYRHEDGWLKNQAGPLNASNDPFASGGAFNGRPALDPGYPQLDTRSPGEKEVIGRITLDYKPVGSPFNATVKVSGSKLDADGPNAGYQLINCGAFKTGTTYGAPDPYGDCKLDNKFSRSGVPAGVSANYPYAKQLPYLDSQVYLASGTANYDFSDLTLTSVTGYFKTITDSFDNYDGTSFSQLVAAEHEKFTSFSQEVRLLSHFDSPVNFLMGGFYQSTNLDFTNNSKILAFGRDPATGKYETWDKPGTTDGKTYSAFGQLIWQIVPTVEFTAGVRYTRETKYSTLTNAYVHPPLSGVSFTPPTKIFTDDFKDSNFSPEATLSWRPTTDITAYASYKTGYKSGGFGLSAVLTPVTIQSTAIAYDSEKVNGFEGGVKAQLFDRRVLLTGSVYSYKYQNLQVNSFNPIVNSFTITNAAAARVKGFELQANVKPVPPLTLYGALAYTEARYINFLASCYGGQVAATGCNVPLGAGVIGQNLTGNPLSRAPDWTLNAGFNLDLPVATSWLVGFSGNAKYSDKFFAVDNGNPGGIQPSFWLLDLSARVGPASDKWQLSLIGRNLTNKYYVSSASEKPGGSLTPGITSQIAGTPARGRQIVLQATVRY